MTTSSYDPNQVHLYLLVVKTTYDHYNHLRDQIQLHHLQDLQGFHNLKKIRMSSIGFALFTSLDIDRQSDRYQVSHPILLVITFIDVDMV